jgi:hypothetical protein
MHLFALLVVIATLVLTPANAERWRKIEVVDDFNLASKDGTWKFLGKFCFDNTDVKDESADGFWVSYISVDRRDAIFVCCCCSLVNNTRLCALTTPIRDS